MAARQMSRARIRIPGNIRGGRAAFRGGFGRGLGPQMQSPRAPFSLDNSGGHAVMDNLEARVRTPPNIDIGLRRENFDDRQEYLPYERRSTLREDPPAQSYVDKRYDDGRMTDRSRETDERSRPIAASRRRSRSRSRSPAPHDYYRRRESDSRRSYSHSSRRSRSRSRSPYGRGDSPRRRRSYSRSPTRSQHPPRPSPYRRELDSREKSFEPARNVPVERSIHQAPAPTPTAPEKRLQITPDKKEDTDFAKLYKEQIAKEKATDRSLPSPRTQEVIPESAKPYPKLDMFEDKNNRELNFSERYKNSSVNDPIGRARDFDILEKSYFGDKTGRDAYGRSLSSFDEKPSQDFKSWDLSPTAKLSGQLPEVKPAVKSILKKNPSSIIQPEEEFNSRSSLSSGIPGLSFEPSSGSSVSKTFKRSAIPGLENISGVDDEESFLYGDRSSLFSAGDLKLQKEDDSENISRSRLFSMDLDEHVREKKLETRYEDFKNFPLLRSHENESRFGNTSSPSRYQRDLSPISKRRQDSFTRELSPFHSRRNEARFNEEFSPKRDDFIGLRGLRDERSESFESSLSADRDSRKKLSLSRNSESEDPAVPSQNSKDLDEVFKSIGIEMVRQLQKRTVESGKNSPFLDEATEAAKLYGIKSDLQTSSYFEGSSSGVKSDVKNILGLIRQESREPSSWQSKFKEADKSAGYSSAAGYSYSAQRQEQQQQQQQQSYSQQTSYQTSQEYSDVVNQDNTNYYTSYSSSQYGTDGGSSSYSAQQQLASGRTNLRMIPLQQQEAKQTNLKVISTSVAELRKEPPKPVPPPSQQVPVKTEPQQVKKPKLSPSERQALAQKREQQLKRLDLMEKEMERLRKQQGELMRKKQKQKDGHKDPLLIENNKLQDEISRQIASIKKVIEDLSDQLRSSIHMEPGNKGSFYEKQRQQAVAEKEKKPAEVKVKTEDEPEMECEYFDAGSHWCKQCNEVLPHLHNLLTHLQDKRHKQGMDPYDRPWLPEALANPPLVKLSKKGLISPIKGVQFLMPVTGFYCSLCSEFMGDASCAEFHVKSKDHNFKYLVRQKKSR